ncbi:12357_t:CDS:2, partial [Funneliformis geosporum]
MNFEGSVGVNGISAGKSVHPGQVSKKWIPSLLQERISSQINDGKTGEIGQLDHCVQLYILYSDLQHRREEDP